MRKLLAVAGALLGLGLLLPACHHAYYHGARHGQHHVGHHAEGPGDSGWHRPHGRYRHRHHPRQCSG